MMCRPSARSTATACAFIVTSSIPCTAPNASSITASAAIPGARPTPASASGSSSAAARTTRRLPTRAASAPVICMATTAATPNSAVTTPSWPGERPRSSLSDGVRTARLAISRPLPPNTTVIAHRARVAAEVAVAVPMPARPPSGAPPGAVRQDDERGVPDIDTRGTAVVPPVGQRSGGGAGRAAARSVSQ
jgi:hypothetical protein